MNANDRRTLGLVKMLHLVGHELIWYGPDCRISCEEASALDAAGLVELTVDGNRLRMKLTGLGCNEADRIFPALAEKLDGRSLREVAERVYSERRFDAWADRVDAELREAFGVGDGGDG